MKDCSPNLYSRRIGDAAAHLKIGHISSELYLISIHSMFEPICLQDPVRLRLVERPS